MPPPFYMQYFSMSHWLAIGLVPGSYFEEMKHLKCRPRWKIYKAYDKKRNPLTYYFVPDRFNFILQKQEGHSNRWILKRRQILKLRKNNLIKSTYLKMRAAKSLADDHRGNGTLL